MKTVTCFALCMWLYNADTKQMDLVEHTYQKSLSACLSAKRVAERTINPQTVKFACGEVKAQVEEVLEKGETTARTRITKVLSHKYEDAY